MLPKNKSKGKNRLLNLVHRHSPKIHPDFWAIYNFANLPVFLALLLRCFCLSFVCSHSSRSFNCFGLYWLILLLLLLLPLFFFYHLLPNIIFLTICQWLAMFCASEVLHNRRNFWKIFLFLLPNIPGKFKILIIILFLSKTWEDWDTKRLFKETTNLSGSWK